MLQLKIPDISQIPSAFITGRDFDYVNICWLKTWKGLELEILFNENGDPVLDQGLIQRIGAYFHKNFQPIRIEGERAYAHICGKR